MGLSIGIIYGVVAMLGYGIGSAHAKYPSKEIGSERTLFFRCMFSSLLLFAIISSGLVPATMSATYIGISLAIALMSFSAISLFYKSLSLGTVGVVTPIANSSSIFTALFAVIFFSESLSMMQVIAILLIISGIIMISINISDFRNSRIRDVSSGIPYAIIACMIWGLVFTVLKVPVSVIGPFMTSFFLELGIFIYAGTYLKMMKKIMFRPDKKIVKSILIVSLAGAIANLSYNIGITQANVSVVSAIAFANPLVAALYARFAMKEKLTTRQAVASALMIAGIILISYY